MKTIQQVILIKADGTDPNGQPISIGIQDMLELKRNFDNGVRFVMENAQVTNEKPAMIPYQARHSAEHGGQALGWVTKLDLSGEQLVAEIDLTGLGREMLEDKRYLSASIFAAKDPVYGWVLKHLAATNDPALPVGVWKMVAENKGSDHYTKTIKFERSYKVLRNKKLKRVAKGKRRLAKRIPAYVMFEGEDEEVVDTTAVDAGAGEEVAEGTLDEAAVMERLAALGQEDAAEDVIGRLMELNEPPWTEEQLDSVLVELGLIEAVPEEAATPEEAGEAATEVAAEWYNYRRPGAPRSRVVRVGRPTRVPAGTKVPAGYSIVSTAQFESMMNTMNEVKLEQKRQNQMTATMHFEAEGARRWVPGKGRRGRMSAAANRKLALLRATLSLEQDKRLCEVMDSLPLTLSEYGGQSPFKGQARMGFESQSIESGKDHGKSLKQYLLEFESIRGRPATNAEKAEIHAQIRKGLVT